MSQTDEILEHLRMGNSITPIEALAVYGVNRLSARIYDLRNKGFNIIKTLKTDPKGKRYASYSLISPHRG